MGANKTYTWAQVRATAANVSGELPVATSPALVVINNKVYDLGGKFAAWHPGGDVALSQVGYDATAFVADVQKLRALVKKEGWDRANPLYYTLKIGSNFAIAGISIAVLALYGSSLPGLLASSLLLAVFWQQSGWLAHDFLHHQVFENRAYNNLVGYLVGNVGQGFSVAWWKHKHCTHHSTTNIHMRDPDIDTMPYLAWSEHALEGFSDISDKQLAKFLVKNQALMFFPLLSFARMMWALQSILWASKSTFAGSFPTSLLLERATLGLHYVWLLGAAFTLTTPLYGLLWILMSQLFCGFLLATVFSLNHNGMPVYSFEEAQSMEFYEISIRTGRNVEPTHFNNWFTGGLNFQIEHHMFPMIPRHNLPKVAPIVQDICKRHNIPYHSTSLFTGLGEVLSRLTLVARLSLKMRMNHAN
ncbi:hypothetical protein HK105_206391 [Polyrhizophydium stewartii]|uniref:Cytochrome b5 heme-binding domain-containing protein n=1 Tax=Polyrhizophydium stewartii TaxID=2732419 RepID=A0ABR4N3T6_9FUNG